MGTRKGLRDGQGNRVPSQPQNPVPVPIFVPPAHAYQYFGGGAQRLLVLGHDADVEDGREDEDEEGSGGGTWSKQGQSGQGPPTLQLSPASPTARTGPVHPHPFLAPPSPGKAFQEPRDAVCWHCPHTPGTELSAERGEPGWGDQGKHAGEEQVPALRCGNQPARTGMGWGIHTTTWSWHSEKGKLRHRRVSQSRAPVRTGAGMLLQHPMPKEGQEQGAATHQSSRRFREWKGQR